MVTISPTSSACLLLLLCSCLSGDLYTGCDAGSTPVLRAINCSTAGNYTPADAYATNLNLLLAALPESTVDKNGGFFNGTAGSPGAPGTAYVLALCAADFTRADCRDCLAAAAATSDDSNRLLSQCPGSTTVAAAYDQCLVHYSDAGFLGSPYTDIVYWFNGSSEHLTMPVYRKIMDSLLPALATLNKQAANTPERFATVQTDPFALVQCTWDLPPDKCKACLDLLAGPNNIWIPPIERKTYSCRLWVSNASFAVFPLKLGALTPDAGSSPPSTLMTPPPDAGSSPPSTLMTPPPDAGSSQPSTLMTPPPDAGSSPPSKNNNDKGPPSSNDKKSSNNKGIIAGVTSSGVALVVVVGGLVFCCCTRGGCGYKRLKAQKGEECQDPKMKQDKWPATNVTTINMPVNVAPSVNATGGSNNNSVPAAGPSSSPGDPKSDGVEASSEGGSPICMTWESLKKITNNFSESRLIGRGAFGKVYKGVKDNDEKIAVKVLPITQLNSEDYEKEFKKEFDIVRGLKHRNIVKLVGYCYETKGELAKREGLVNNIFIALCFEYMEKGSLEKHLHDETGGMDWQTRFKIIMGTCNGLKYLHDEVNDPIFHLDLKPGNILLSMTYVPKIADFGISKLVLDNRTEAPTSFKATWRYSPPEYKNGGESLKYLEEFRSKRKNLEKYDIFSLGVVMMEIIAGSEGYDNIDEDKKYIDQVQEKWRNRQPLEYECVKRCIEIALTCIEDDPAKRPEIKVIVRMLEETEDNAKKLATTSTSQNGT